MIRKLLRRLWACIVLAVIFIRELLLSSVAVALQVVARQAPSHPAIIAVPIELQTDAGITAVANMISLTPGTTSLHVSPDKRLLYVHCLNAPEADVVANDIKQAFELWVKRVEQP